MSDVIDVLHVVTSLESGGMENGVVNLARTLEPRGVRMHFACLEREGDFVQRLPEPRCVQVMGKRGGFSPAATGRLAREIARLRPSVVHSHNLGPLIYSGLATAFGLRCALVHGEHSQLTQEELKPRRLRQRKFLYRVCRAVHTVSQGIYDELLALGFPAERLRVIVNGVDCERFAPGDAAEAKRALGIPTNSIVTGMVGRFGPYKRHGLLISAFEAVAARFPSAALLIVGGGGSEEQRVRELAGKSPLAARIHLAGFRSDPVPCYQAMDLVAIPSVNEGMSNAALEAMSCGIPVLANTGCGHEQIMENGATGTIADLRDRDALVQHWSIMLEHPERLKEQAMRARQSTMQRFSLRAMADAYENLYRSAASRS